MNTLLRGSQAPHQTALAPTSLTAPRGAAVSARIPRGVWIGGGLMAMTIVALATALIVRSGDSASASTSQPSAALTAAAIPTTTLPAGDPASAAVVPSQLAVPTPPVPTPVPTVARHTSTTTHTTRESNNSPAVTANNSPAPTRVDSGYNNNSSRVSSVPVCTTCGVIESYDAVQLKGEGTGIGAVAGGGLGAVLGSKIAGRRNHTMGGAIGAIGGGLLGHEIEKRQRATTVYDVHVRMTDGSTRTIRQSTMPQVGSRVSVEGDNLRAAPQSQSPSYNGANTYVQPSAESPAPPNDSSSSFSASGR